MESGQKRKAYNPILRNTYKDFIRSLGKSLSSETFNPNLIGYRLINWDWAKFLVAAILPKLENIRTDVGISLQGSFIKLRSFSNPNSYHLLDLYLVNWGGMFSWVYKLDLFLVVSILAKLEKYSEGPSEQSLSYEIEC